MSFAFSGSCAPIENSPPGIHTMPSGADPGGVPVFAAVSTNADVSGIAVAAGVGVSRERVALTAYAPTPATTIAAINHDARHRRTGGDEVLVRLRGDLLICLLRAPLPAAT